jgi:hypothetical protein
MMAVTGEIAPAQAREQGKDAKPGIWYKTIQTERLTDYVFLAETPFQKVYMGVLDRQGNTVGYATERTGDKNEFLPLAVSLDGNGEGPNQYNIVLANPEFTTAKFGLKVFKIAW